jgi:hypothetical protein
MIIRVLISFILFFSSVYTLSYQHNFNDTLSTVTAVDCYDACLNDTNCFGISFTSQAFIENCHLMNEKETFDPSCIKQILYQNRTHFQEFSIDQIQPKGIYEQNIRLYDHYRKINHVRSTADCFEICFNDTNCKAITFPPNTENSCFLYNSYKNKKSFKSWTSVFKLPPDTIVRNDLKIGHYLEREDNCGKCKSIESEEEERICIRTEAVISKQCESTCYYYVYDKQEKLFNGWISVLNEAKRKNVS